MAATLLSPAFPSMCFMGASLKGGGVLARPKEGLWVERKETAARLPFGINVWLSSSMVAIITSCLCGSLCTPDITVGSPWTFVACGVPMLSDAHSSCSNCRMRSWITRMYLFPDRNSFAELSKIDIAEPLAHLLFVNRRTSVCRLDRHILVLQSLAPVPYWRVCTSMVAGWRRGPCNSAHWPSRP